MRATRRRRLDTVLLGGAALAGGLAALIGGIAGDTERIPRMWVGASVDADGAASMVEVIDYDFGSQERRGIFRTIPGLSLDAPVAVESASAPDRIDQAAPVALANGEAAVQLRIGDPDTTVTGRHRYRLDYPLPSGVIMRGELVAWDAVGTEWEAPIGEVEVHLVAPFELRPEECSVGRAGQVGGCELAEVEPGHLVATAGSLEPGEGVTVEATRGSPLAAAPALPAPPTDAPPDPGAGLLAPAAVATAGTLGGAAVSSRLVRRRGRERVGAGSAADAAWAGDAVDEVLLDHSELRALATTEFAPPEGITPAMGGIVLKEAVDDEHKVAWLIEAAIEGAVELEEEDGGAVRLVRTGPGSPATAAVLDTAFRGRPVLDLGSYDSSFAEAWRKLTTVLEHWKDHSGLWDPEGDRRLLVARGLGVLAAIAGAIGIAVGGALAGRWGAGWLLLVGVSAVVAGAGVAAAIRGWELRVRTPAGSGAWLRVESFRRFLAESEAYHAEEAAKRGVLREYTAWAVAVGEIDRWERAVATAAAAAAIPAAAGLGYVHLAPMLMSSTRAAATAPSSSGGGGGFGGGFGGGGVGGGGGGGGGGSW